MIIPTQHLLLREFGENDWEAVLAHQSDPRYLRLYPWTDRYGILAHEWEHRATQE